jgi:carboxymethylenebutenolidase
VQIPELDAVVCYYGIPPLEAADPRAMRTAFQGHFATRDDWCTPQAAAELEKSLQRSGVEYEIYHYDAEHGFFNEEEADKYHERSASRSWERTLAFLGRHLRP